MLNVRVVEQPLVVSLDEMLMLTAPALGQLSVAVTRAFTLSFVGGFAGLQPRSPPAGTLVIAGGVVSMRVIVCVTVVVFPQVSVTTQVRRIVWLHRVPLT